VSGSEMVCVACNSENPPNAKFCIQCGAPFKSKCGNCGAEALPNFKFCAECGATLGRAPRADSHTTFAAKSHVSAAPVAERRHLTVLFCDLVDSTRIAAQLDPEEWRDIVAAYHRHASAAITRVGGHIAKYLGDGVMAFFGYPAAHDN